MITSQEALRKVLENKVSFGLEKIPISSSIGRVLREEVRADRSFPPFNRVCMDGIAISYQEELPDVHCYKVESLQPAGHPQQVLRNSHNCIEVMTGAVLPKNTDTVIRYEDLEKKENGFVICTPIKPQSNIHFEGMDISFGEIILTPNQKITSPMIGVLASVGISEVTVSKLPSIAIISTGDELVEVDEKPLPHQIRKSNVIVFDSIFAKWNINSTIFHLPDNLDSLKGKLKIILDEFDCLILSGAVSKGKFDYLPDALAELDVEKIFHGVKQRPGKPFWFGSKNQTKVFAFPGNPVSALVCYIHYFRPWLVASINSQKPEQSLVKLKKDIDFVPDLTYFAPAVLEKQGNEMYAEISKGNGSGDLVNVAKVNGFVTLPRGKSVFKKGEIYEFIPL